MCRIEGNYPFQLPQMATCTFFGEFPHFASPYSPKASSRKKTSALVGQSPRDQTYNSPKPRRKVGISLPIGQSPRDQTYNPPKPRPQVSRSLPIGQSPRPQPVNPPKPSQTRINHAAFWTIHTTTTPQLSSTSATKSETLKNLEKSTKISTKTLLTSTENCVIVMLVSIFNLYSGEFPCIFMR